MFGQAGTDGTTGRELLAALGHRNVASGRASVRTFERTGTQANPRAPHEAGTVGEVIVE